MIEKGVYGVDFIAVNTDALHLSKSKASARICIGKNVTRYLGTGGDPQRGEKAAVESIEKLRSVIARSDMVFITAGMGGGTGSGAAPVVAKVAQELGAFTIAIVTRPFLFEGSTHAQVAEANIAKLEALVDTLVVISNDRLLYVVNEETSIGDAFHMVNDILYRTVQGISEMITVPGLINLDFADVRTVMSKPGSALIGVGCAKGEDRARLAAEQAMCSPLLDVTIAGARDILINITAGPGLCLDEIRQVTENIRETIHPDANLIFGTAIDNCLGDTLRVTVVATGLEQGVPYKALLPLQSPPTYDPEMSMSVFPVPPEPAEGDPRVFSLEEYPVPAFLRRG
jgi:cell division protein FtsZ